MQILLFVAKRPFGVIMLCPPHDKISPSQKNNPSFMLSSEGLSKSIENQKQMI
jgi:hypothetical protein